MAGINTIFENGEVIWHMHTTYTLDYSYEAALFNKNENMAVFYNSKSNEKNIMSGNVDATILQNARNCCFAVCNNRQEYHAKISLVCIKNTNDLEEYRLMVYSKNHGFTATKCADIALAFVLNLNKPEKDDDKSRAENNGIELCSYLKKTYDLCQNQSGKDWMKKNKLIDQLGKCSNLFQYVSLESIDFPEKKDWNIIFGGCDDTVIWEKINILRNREDLPKLILTPPIFVSRSYKNENEFQQVIDKGILYETKTDNRPDNYPLASHIKLYLFNDYIFTGSANMTKAGIGYDVVKNKPMKTNTSIECLVGHQLKEDEFETIKQEIEEYYEKCNGEGNFKHFDDETAIKLLEGLKVISADYLDDNGNVLTPVYKTYVKAIRLILKYTGDEINLTDHNLSIYLAEYSDKRRTLNEIVKKDSEIKYVADFTSPKSTTGILIVEGYRTNSKNEKKTIRYAFLIDLAKFVNGIIGDKKTEEKDVLVSDILKDCNNSREDIERLVQMAKEYDNDRYKAFVDVICEYERSRGTNI